MKQHIYTNVLSAILLSAGLSLGLASCEADKYYELPEVSDAAPTVDLAALNFTHEPGAGEITIKWDKPASPEEAGFMYMKMVYTDPRDLVTRTKTISAYSGEVVIPNTRARYGDKYSFTFTPYSESNKAGTPFTLDKCKSDAAPATKTTEYVKLKLSNLQTNAQEPSEGPLVNLTDGNTSTHFHTSFSNPGIAPKHYVDMDLGEEVDRMEIHVWNRVAYNNPVSVELYRIDEIKQEEMGELFHSYAHPNPNSGAESKYMYPLADDPAMETPVRYLRFCPIGPSVFWNMAELEISKVIVNVFDPETDEKEPGETDTEAGTDSESEAAE